MSPKEKLRELVVDFLQWLIDNYDERDIAALNFDDAGYPGWSGPENYFAELINQKLLSTLDQDDRINLLYLIARNWDCGRMLNWLHEEGEITTLGKIEISDFLKLSSTVASLPYKEFKDAKCQFAASFKKLPELTPEAEKILLDLYHDPDEFTNRQALMALAKHGYKDIRTLIHNSWFNIKDEHSKMGCLFVIDRYLQDEDLMQEYLELAKSVEGEYFKNYVKELKEKYSVI